jgi:hypothetical protein
MILCKAFKVSKNKCLETALHCEKNPRSLFLIEIGCTRRCCHSGLRLCAGIGWAWFEINFYDIRHWDYGQERWEKD